MRTFENTQVMRVTHHVHTDKNRLHPVAKHIVARRDWRGVDCVDLVGCPASSQFASASPTLT